MEEDKKYISDSIQNYLGILEYENTNKSKGTKVGFIANIYGTVFIAARTTMNVPKAVFKTNCNEIVVVDLKNVIYNGYTLIGIKSKIEKHGIPIQDAITNDVVGSTVTILGRRKISSSKITGVAYGCLNFGTNVQYEDLGAPVFFEEKLIAVVLHTYNALPISIDILKKAQGFSKFISKCVK
eukprot:Mrub_11345.p1 GENE.Mrub_11345~~Mrub_11345.p1  ORF type:complete len:193 (-),score=6.56 Mrub_11345:45-590(-)